MFRRAARMLPFMKSLKTLQIAGVEEEESVVLAHALKTWPPPLLETEQFFPPLCRSVAAEDSHMLMHAWGCMTVVKEWQVAVLPAQAFLCGTHAAMGAASQVAWLHRDVLKMIVAQLLGRVPRPFTIHDLVDDNQIRSA